MTPGNGQIYTSPRLFSVQQGNIPALPLPTSSLLPVAQEPSCSPAWSCPQGKIWAAGASHTIPKIHIPGAGQGSRMLPCSTFPFCCWHSQILGKSRIWGCPRRAVLLCQPLHRDREEKQECGGFLSTSSLGDWIQQLLSINSPRIPNYLLLPA